MIAIRRVCRRLNVVTISGIDWQAVEPAMPKTTLPDRAVLAAVAGWFVPARDQA
jgi:hypothetical protein